MNVVFTIRYFYPFIGGTENQAQALAATLVKKGVSVKIITSRFEKRWPARETVDGVEIVRLCSPRIKVVGAILFLLCLAGYLITHRRKISLIHTFQIGYTSTASIMLGKVLKKPSVIKLASSGEGGDIQRAKSTPLGRLFLAIGKKASAVIVLNTAIERELSGERFTPHKVHPIYNGVDLARFRKVSVKRQLRNKLKLADKRTIVYTGRLSREKGVEVLIQSFSRLKGNGECQLLIIADGPERETILQQLHRTHVSQSAQLIRTTDDVVSYLNASDLFVLPSRFEGMSNSLLEAMACGLPVIATRVGGSVDIIDDGENGLLVDVDSVEQLALAISKVLRDPLLAADLGKRARRTVAENFDLLKVAEKYRELYSELDKACQV